MIGKFKKFPVIYTFSRLDSLYKIGIPLQSLVDGNNYSNNFILYKINRIGE